MLFQQTEPPIADFMADRIFIAPGDFINFTDRSKGSPYIWKWFFEGASTNIISVAKSKCNFIPCTRNL